MKPAPFPPQFPFTLRRINRAAAIGRRDADRVNSPPGRKPSPGRKCARQHPAGGARQHNEIDTLRDLFPAEWKPKIKRALLGADSWIDFGLFRGAVGARETWERFSTFMDRFHVAGWRRWANEFASEAATLGTAGGVLMVALAIPAFHDTSGDWLQKSDLSVTFLDRYGNEIGVRGIRRNDSVPLDQFPDHLIKAVIATEDRRFYDHFGIDVPGIFRALVTNARAGGVVQGGSSITQQLAKNLFLTNQRTLDRKIKEAFLALWLEARLSK
ncbi:MAG: transglycosylase domain-containing protein, partial [Stellaceae bacterium]